MYKHVVNALLEQCEDDINLAVKKAGHNDHFTVTQEIKREYFLGKAFETKR